jgi:hypothetical protein
MRSELCSECIDAEKKSDLNINSVLDRISSYKNEKDGQLSDKDILYICLSMCLYSKAVIAYRMYRHEMPKTLEDLANWKELSKKIKYLNSEMSHRSHFWIKNMMGVEGTYKKINWLEFIKFCQENGCKNEESKSVCEAKKEKNSLKQKGFILSATPSELEKVKKYIENNCQCKILQEFNLENE